MLTTAPIDCHSGIYKILHAASGRAYVGSAVHIVKRIAQHKRALIAGKHLNTKLQNAWNKYGRESFEFSVLELVPNSADLIGREQAWIDELNCVRAGFNISPTAGSTYGYRHSEETKARMSKERKGKHHNSPEVVERIRLQLVGRSMTDEQRAKMSEAKRGKSRGPHSEATREKMRLAAAGRQFSEEHKAKLSAAKRGKPIAPETAALRAANQAARKAHQQNPSASNGQTSFGEMQ